MPSSTATRRFTNCVIVSIATFIATYLAVIVANAVDTVTSFATVLGVLMGPWIAILIVRHYELQGHYQVLDLHAYAYKKGKRGVYWYSAGFGVRALVAWAVAAAVGLLWSSTTLYTGPLTHVTKGIDISFLSAFCVGFVVYWALGVYSAPAEEKVITASREA